MDAILDFLTPVVLFFNSKVFYFAFIILGFYISTRNYVFGRALMLLAFVMILNPYLKSLFQIPLPETAGHPGWAFPSGHVLASASVYGLVMWEFRKRQRWLKIVAPLFVISASYFTVRRGYHYPEDVIVSLALAPVIIFGFRMLLKFKLFSRTPHRITYPLILLACPFMWYNPVIDELPHIFLAFGILFGFPIGWHVTDRVRRRYHIKFWQKFLAAGIAFVLMFLFDSVFSTLLSGSNELVFLKYFLLTSILAGLPLPIIYGGSKLWRAYFPREK